MSVAKNILHSFSLKLVQIILATLTSTQRAACRHLGRHHRKEFEGFFAK